MTFFWSLAAPGAFSIPLRALFAAKELLYQTEVFESFQRTLLEGPRAVMLFRSPNIGDFVIQVI